MVLGILMAGYHLVGGERATAVATVTAGYVTAVTVTSSGSGYLTEPAVTLSGGGGSGATARAILSGDRVALVVVLTAGIGFMSSPSVTIEAPPPALGVRIETVPKLTVEGPVGRNALVELATELSGPWTLWSNVVVSAEGTVLVDLRPGAVGRFYRARLEPGPAGFVWIPPGTFIMGSPTGQQGSIPDEVRHSVTLTEGFWLSDHETTQAEFHAVVGNNPSSFMGENLPVETVSWHEAVLYCQKLTERERAAGRITAQQAYRLPTEAEWEYAARAGTIEAWPGALGAIAWLNWNSGNQARPVKVMQPNDWGLFDMIGNVWEWCADWYGEYPTGSVTDPRGPSLGSNRVQRGGSWYTDGWSARSARRSQREPGIQSSDLGFRPALSSVR
jgi:formylglycine-generating enzyme required for sulfatase activity